MRTTCLNNFMFANVPSIAAVAELELQNFKLRTNEQ